MKRFPHQTQSWWTGAAVLALVLGAAAGCKHQPARSDEQIAVDAQGKIEFEPALAGQGIRVSIANGVVTLSGAVKDEASRALAERDIAAVDGVKTVVNNLAVEPQQPVSAPAPTPQASAAPRVKEKSNHDRPALVQPAPPPPLPPPAQVAQNPPSAPPALVQTARYTAPAPALVQTTQNPAPAAPPAPPKPTTKTVTLPAGTTLSIRLTETLDSGRSQPNEAFHGALANDISDHGLIVLPRGTPVMGRIVDVREAAHFKGNAFLSIELTEMTARGQRVSLETDPVDKAGEGRGKNTAEKVGGGGAFGAILGGIAGGGKGALIGTLAGAAAGTGVNAATRGQQVVFPSESVVNFSLRSHVTLTVPLNPEVNGDHGDLPDPQLQHRN
jgi:hypothetical protein